MANLTAEKAIDILNDTLDTLALPENIKKLDEVRESNGNEMLKMMQFVFPVVMQIQMDVVKKHGLGDGREGLVKFAQNLRSLEREDPEVARLHNLIRSYYLPPVSVSATGDSAAEMDKNSSN